MAEQHEELGKYARHPVRTAGAAFLMGLGAGMMASNMRRRQEKTGFHKFLDQLGIDK